MCIANHHLKNANFSNVERFYFKPPKLQKWEVVEPQGGGSQKHRRWRWTLAQAFWEQAVCNENFKINHTLSLIVPFLRKYPEEIIQ